MAMFRRQDCTTGRIKGAQHRRQAEGQLQRVEARLGFDRPCEPRRRAAKRRQRRSDLGVALHEAPVVVGEPREATHLAHDVGVANSTMDCTSRGSTDTPSAESQKPKETEPLPPEHALGALGVELPAGEDLEQIGDVEQMLFHGGECTRQSPI